MAKPRELTDQAIDCALHKIPEPGKAWRAHLPPDDLGSMVDNGSGQIGLQGLVACLVYGPIPWAVRVLNLYADVCRKRFMLSEPWSTIYGSAIVSCWLAVAILAERIGEVALARKFRELLKAWAATCAVMETRWRNDVWIFPAGCRSWGHRQDEGGMHALWRIASGRRPPVKAGSKQYGTPGAFDDWGWLTRSWTLGHGILRECSIAYVGGDPLALLTMAPRWAARTEMQLLGWADGSRLWIMGDDDQAFDDEDANSNTPGWLAAGVVGGALVSLPKWPDPFTGRERIRQTNVRADIDGNPSTGWTLWHSDLGERKSPDGSGYLTRLEPYTKSPLIFHVEIPAEDDRWRFKVGPGMSAPVVTPNDDTEELPIPIQPKPKRKRPWWRFW